MLTLLLGGARSGKSSLALEIVGRSGLPVTFIATAQPSDDEFASRIERHRTERPAEWHTIEEPIDLESALGQVPDGAAAVVDCLTLWVANLFDHGLDDEVIVERAAGIASAARRRRDPVVIVSNEVGSGIVPADALSRRYRDALGRVNATVASGANQAFLVVAGRMLALAKSEVVRDGTEGPLG
jgi:adenosylcobinamide kinase/adenosylcobinamide-phosphate guanylyltransferase